MREGERFGRREKDKFGDGDMVMKHTKYIFNDK